MNRHPSRRSARVETDAALLWEAMKITGLSAKETAELALRDAIAGAELYQRLLDKAESAAKKA